MKNNTLHLNKIPQKKYFAPPIAKSILALNGKEQAKIDKLSNMVHSDPVVDKSSIFRGHALKVKSSTKICAAYNKLKILYPESDHIMIAYQIKQHMGHHNCHTPMSRPLKATVCKSHFLPLRHP